MYQYLTIATFVATLAVVSGGHGYHFKYSVHDPHTQDIKDQWETKHGDLVQGSYSLVEPDGSLRVVDYSADDLRGFNAVVNKYGHSEHLQQSPIIFYPRLNSLGGPVNYGFGPKPIIADLPMRTSSGIWSHPWNPHTHSYGGWKPKARPPVKKPYLTIVTRHIDENGHFHKWVQPIPMNGRVILKKTVHY